MNRLVFLVEGEADEAFLRAFLPLAGVPEEQFHVYPQGGKPALVSDFYRLLRAWRGPAVRFIILVDQDIDDCKQLKRKIKAVARKQCENQSKDLLVRIACREAEAWYLGDIAALREAYPDARQAVWRKINRRINDPDDARDPKPSDLLREIPGFAKQDAAEKMGDILGRKWAENANGNRSASFRCFVSGVMKMWGE